MQISDRLSKQSKKHELREITTNMKNHARTHAEKSPVGISVVHDTIILAEVKHQLTNIKFEILLNIFMSYRVDNIIWYGRTQFPTIKYTVILD